MRIATQKYFLTILLTVLYLLIFSITTTNHNHPISWDHHDACPVDIFLYTSNFDTLVLFNYQTDILECRLILREKLPVFPVAYHILNNLQPRAPHV
jgi:hypothetical protein